VFTELIGIALSELGGRDNSACYHFLHNMRLAMIVQRFAGLLEGNMSTATAFGSKAASWNISTTVPTAVPRTRHPSGNIVAGLMTVAKGDLMRPAVKRTWRFASRADQQIRSFFRTRRCRLGRDDDET
jgi:hypothetical protein